MPDLSDTGNFDDGADKLNFPAELPADKRTSGGEFTCVLALFSAPNSVKKRCRLRNGMPNLHVFPTYTQVFGILSPPTRQIKEKK